MTRPSTDAALVERLRAGDATAVTELSTRYGAKIFQLAFRYMKNREDAEEVSQDVLLKIFRKIKAFRGDAALSSWIYRITFNTAMSRLRSARASRGIEIQQNEPSTLEPNERYANEPADWSSLADDHVLRNQMRERLIASLALLPQVYRTPVILRDIQGLSTEEASAVLGVKPQTLKSRLHRGRLLLREHLADFAGGVMLHAREAQAHEAH
jgi:RNA polymerase sigma-70 factor (ECF subfamily)